MPKQTQGNSILVNGFSLIELMITLSILGILVGIGGVYYQRNWQQEKLKSVTKEAALWLEDARLNALQQSRTCVIEIDEENKVFRPALNDSRHTCLGLSPLQVTTNSPKNNALIICSQSQSLEPSLTRLACSRNTNNEEENGTTEPTKFVITPRGTLSEGGLIKLHLDQAIADRCIAVTKPLGLIRQGIDRGMGCVYTTAF